MQFPSQLEHFYGVSSVNYIIHHVLLKLTLKLVINDFSATAQSVQTMIIGRVLAGIGIGISSAIVPLYISEVARVCKSIFSIL